jgi:hypothetical protein
MTYQLNAKEFIAVSLGLLIESRALGHAIDEEVDAGYGGEDP